MHEIAIAQKIAKAAEDAAIKNNIKKVSRVRLRLGQMAAAGADQLKFGFTTHVKGTHLEGAELEIEEVKIVLTCPKCSNKFYDPQFDDSDFTHTIAHAPMVYVSPPCPKCGVEGSQITRGQEMELIDLEGE